MIDIPPDQDLVLLANYRTGSTAFLDFLATSVKLKNLDEAFHAIKPNNWFKEYYKPYSAIKIMPDQVSHPDASMLLDNSYVISISRRDIVAQIASFYVAAMTQNWHTRSCDIKSQCYCVELQNYALENETRYILKMNQKQKTLIKQFSKRHFYYEDVLKHLLDSSFQKTVQPANYNELYEWIKNWIGHVQMDGT